MGGGRPSLEAGSTQWPAGKRAGRRQISSFPWQRRLMKFSQIYRSRGPVISFELFPPKTEEGMKSLESRLPRMIELAPDFMTVTYGAMGTTREKTLEIASRIKNRYGMETAHHLTCVGASRAELDAQIEAIGRQGIENIVALRGDPPQGKKHFEAHQDGYSNAHQLVEHIRAQGGFSVAVAGYPEKHIEAPDYETDLLHLKNKVDCGADAIITQLFYTNQSYYRFVERCQALGIRQPIIPGLLPILSTQQIKRISSLCGCTLPGNLLDGLHQAGDDKTRVCDLGIEYTVRQALDLLDHGVEGIHFYVLNRYFHIAEIMNGIRSRLKELRAARQSGQALGVKRQASGPDPDSQI